MICSMRPILAHDCAQHDVDKQAHKDRLKNGRRITIGADHIQPWGT
jgi:hypothetical protein